MLSLQSLLICVRIYCWAAKLSCFLPKISGQKHTHAHAHTRALSLSHAHTQYMLFINSR
uniref:Uncharacterized protein n=1 Tax=Octopus bimaculoides TaxID=37653 RepID=A0A0L8GYF1_OCTBM